MIKKTFFSVAILFVLLFTLVATPTPVYADGGVEVVHVVVGPNGPYCAWVELSDGSIFQIIGTFDLVGGGPATFFGAICRGVVENPPEQNIQSTLKFSNSFPTFFVEISPSGNAIAKLGYRQ